MAAEHARIDISDSPDLLRLAEQVRRDGQPRVLSREDEDLVVVAPARPRRRLKGKVVTAADIEAALSVAAAWKDWMDSDNFKQQRRELQVHDREPRTL